MNRFVASLFIFSASLLQVRPEVPRTISYQGRVQVSGSNFTGTGQFKFALVSKGTNVNRQATAVATVTSGFVTSISVTDGGLGYSAPPTVSITDPTGSGAVASANVAGGSVTSITMHNAGSGYSSPTVLLGPPSTSFVYGTYWSNDGTSSAGNQPLAAVLVPVQQGLFTVLLGDQALANMTPIPPTIFANNDVHLRVWFNDGVQGFVQLTPDQPIASVGYAMAANILPQSIASSNLVNGSVGAAQLGDAAVTGVKIADGTITVNKLVTQTDYSHPSEQTVLSNPVSSDGQFGNFVTRVGDRLYVGGSDASSNAVIYVFELDGTFVRTIATPARVSDGFGAGAVAVASNRLLVGAPLHTAGTTTNTGIAYLFNTDSGLFTTINNPAGDPGAYFGYSVAAVPPDKLIVCSPTSPSFVTNMGHAYVFNFAGALLATLSSPIPFTDDLFGISATTLGDGRIAVGAPLAHGGATNSGLVHLYNPNFSFFRTLTNPVPHEGGTFGVPVTAFSSNRLLVGAIGADYGGTNAGAVYIYNSVGTLLGTITNPVPSLAMGIPITPVDDNRILVGAYNSPSNIFLLGLDGQLIGTVPGPQGGYLASGFGPTLVALPGDRIAVPHYLESNVVINSFSDRYVPNLIADGVRGNSIGTAQLMDGSVTADKLAPGAISATNLADGSITGDKLAIESVNSSHLQDGTVLAELLDDDGPGSGLNADLLDNLDSSAFWRVTGNAGTTTANFLGTTDNRALELKVNNQRALRLEPTSFPATPNLIGGSSNNFAEGGIFGATIGGGGSGPILGVTSTNAVGGNFGTIGGGKNNRILTSAEVSTIAGGDGNRITSNAFYSAIGGGRANTISNFANFSVVAGGEQNFIGLATTHGTIAGGYWQEISTNADNATIGGGYRNRIGANAIRSTIGGGFQNEIGTNSPFSFIGGGSQNTIGTNSTGTITAGSFNDIGPSSTNSVIAGGRSNTVGSNSQSSVIMGGLGNEILPNSSFAVVAGGESSFATNRAFAAGTFARANHNGSFVWGDSTASAVSSTNNNSVTMRATGGYRLLTSSPVTAGVFLAPGGGSWVAMSDRNAKENFHPVDAQAILDKVVALPMTTWNYKSQADSVRHMGPMAQDFSAAFGIGDTETGITTVDADGVALAAIQGLNQKLEAQLREKNSEIQTLKERLDELDDLKRTVTELQQLLRRSAP